VDPKSGSRLALEQLKTKEQTCDIHQRFRAPVARDNYVLVHLSVLAYAETIEDGRL
jgi:hypothetical protein